MQSPRLFRLVLLTLLTALMPLLGSGALASPVVEGSPVTAAVANLPIYTLNCDADPGALDPTAMPAGCEQGGPGIQYDVVTTDGAMVGSCLTNSVGQCEMSAFDGEQVLITETAATIPPGYAPRTNPIPWTVSALPTDNVPVFVNVKTNGAAATPTSQTHGSPATSAPARKVTGSSIYLGDNARTGRLPGERPRGHVGIAAELNIPHLLDAEAVVDGILFGLKGNKDASTVAAWDVSSGELIWSLNLPDGASVAPPTIANGIAYAALSDGTVLALSAGDGKELWRAKGLPKGQTGVPGIALVDGGKVFLWIGTYASAFDATTGKRLWAVQPKVIDSLYPRFHPLLADHHLLFPIVSTNESQSGAAFLVNLDEETGKLNWVRYNDSTMPFSVGGDQIYGCFEDQFGYRNLVKINSATGDEIKSTAECNTSVSIAPEGTLVYESLSSVVSTSPIDDSVLWSIDIPDSSGAFVGPPLSAGGLVFQAEENSVLALDPKTGTIAWQLQFPCATILRMFAIQDGRIYLQTKTGLIVLGGDAGSNKTTFYKPSVRPISEGVFVAVTKDVTLVDDASDSAFPVADLKAGDTLTVTGPSVQAEGKTWWPVSSNSGDGYLPESVLTVTGCPSQ